MDGREGEVRGGEKGGGFTHRGQGPGAEGSDASREGLGETTYTQLIGGIEKEDRDEVLQSKCLIQQHIGYIVACINK